MVSLVLMYGCESWTLKKAEHWRIDAFELGCWRRLLRVPWTDRRSNQSILQEISPEYSLEGLMLKLKHQYFGHLMQRTDSLEKTLMLGKIEGERKRGWQRGDGWMESLTQWTWVWTSSRSWWWTEKPGVLQSIESQRVGHDWATELNWKECLQWVALRLNTSSPFKPSTFSTHFFIWRSCHPHTSAAPLYPSPALYLIFHTVPVSSLPSVPLAITLVHNSVTSSHIS